MAELSTLIMHDGSRYFGDLPQTTNWYLVRDEVVKLPGAELKSFVTDHITEAWIDFSYQGHQFSINDQYGDYWFFVKDPACPDAILLAVLEHFKSLLVTD